MKTIIFKITKRKKISHEFLTLDFHRKYPTHFEQFGEAENIVVYLDYEPTNSLNEDEYISQLTKILYKKYNAYSIDVGILENQLKE